MVYIFKPTVSHYFIKLLDDKGLLLRNYTQVNWLFTFKITFIDIGRPIVITGSTVVAHDVAMIMIVIAEC